MQFKSNRFFWLLSTAFWFCLLLFVAGSLQSCGPNPEALLLEIAFPSGETYPKATHKLIIQLETERAGELPANLKSPSKEVVFSVPNSLYFQMEITGETLKNLQSTNLLELLPPEKLPEKAQFESVKIWLEDKNGNKLSQGTLKKPLKYKTKHTVQLKKCSDSNACAAPTTKELCDGKDNDDDGWIDEGDACPIINPTLTISGFWLSQDSQSLLTLEQGSPKIYQKQSFEGFTAVSTFSMTSLSDNALITAGNNFFAVIHNKQAYKVTFASGVGWKVEGKDLAKSTSTLAPQSIWMTATSGTDNILVHARQSQNHAVFKWNDKKAGKKEEVNFLPTLLIPPGATALKFTTDRNKRSYAYFPLAGAMQLVVHNHESAVATKEKECSLTYSSGQVTAMGTKGRFKMVGASGVVALLDRVDNRIRVLESSTCKYNEYWEETLKDTFPSGTKLQDLALIPLQDGGLWLITTYTANGKLWVRRFLLKGKDEIKTSAVSYTTEYTGLLKLQASLEDSSTALLLVQTDTRKISTLRLTLTP